MESIIITPKSKSEMKFITSLLKRINIKSTTLKIQQKEDIALSKAIDESMNDEGFVSEKEIMKVLKNQKNGVKI